MSMSADFASISKRLPQPIAARNVKPMKILSRSLTNRSLPLRGVYAVEDESNSPTPMSDVDQELLAKFVKRSSHAEPRGSQFFSHNDRPTSSVSSPSTSLLTGRTSRTESLGILKRVSTSATNLRVISALSHSKHEEEQEEADSSTDEDTKTESLLDAQAAEVRLRPRAQSSGRPYTPFETRAASAAAMYKVLEFLHCGNIESAFNAQLLCRLRIGFLLDATGLDPSKMPRNIRNSLPCMCKSPMAHTRNEMALEINETTAPDAVVAVFAEVNRFIMAARAQGKQVLIFSEDGKNSSQALAIQYIMSYHNLPVSKAIAYFETNCIQLRLTNNFRAALTLWEKQLRETADKKREDSIRALRPDHASSKNAWH